MITAGLDFRDTYIVDIRALIRATARIAYGEKRRRDKRVHGGE